MAKRKSTKTQYTRLELEPAQRMRVINIEVVLRDGDEKEINWDIVQDELRSVGAAEIISSYLVEDDFETAMDICQNRKFRG